MRSDALAVWLLLGANLTVHGTVEFLTDSRVAVHVVVPRALFAPAASRFTVRFPEGGPGYFVSELSALGDGHAEPLSSSYALPGEGDLSADFVVQLPDRFVSRSGAREVPVSLLVPEFRDDEGNLVHAPASILASAGKGRTVSAEPRLEARRLTLADIAQPGVSRLILRMPEPTRAQLMRPEFGLGGGVAFTSAVGEPFVRGLIYGEFWLYVADLRVDLILAGAQSRIDPRLGARLRLGGEEGLDVALGAGPSFSFVGDRPVRPTFAAGVGFSVVELQAVLRTGAEFDLSVTLALNVGQLAALAFRLAVGFGTS